MSWPVLRPRHPQPRRPRVLPHGPVAAVLRRRRPAMLAGQEQRDVRPFRTLRTLPDGSELSYFDLKSRGRECGGWVPVPGGVWLGRVSWPG